MKWLCTVFICKNREDLTGCRDTTPGNCMKGLAVPEMKQRTAKMCVIHTPDSGQQYCIAKRVRLRAAASFSIDDIAALKQPVLCKTTSKYVYWSKMRKAWPPFKKESEWQCRKPLHMTTWVFDILNESSLSPHFVMTMASCYPGTYQVHVFIILLTCEQEWASCEHLSNAQGLQQPAMTIPVCPQHVSANVLQAL